MFEHQTSGAFVLVVGRVMRYLVCCTGTADLYLAVLRRFLICFLATLPRGVPGEGRDYHFPKEIGGFGPIPARILGFLIFILALSTANPRGTHRCHQTL